LIRRANLSISGRLSLGRIRIDVSGRQLQIDNEPVELTGREWLVLECPGAQPGACVQDRCSRQS